MTKSFEKARKQIARKRHGNISNLHENSRDGKRLHRASVRDEKLEKLAASRRRQEKPMIDRVRYFKEAVEKKGGGALALETIQGLISAFVHRHDEEMDAIRKQRRAGRPPPARESLLQMKTDALEAEHKQGFLLPDLTTTDNVALLDRWEGSWSYLTNLAWVRVTAAGQTNPSGFPPNKDH